MTFTASATVWLYIGGCIFGVPALQRAEAFEGEGGRGRMIPLVLLPLTQLEDNALSAQNLQFYNRYLGGLPQQGFPAEVPL